MPLTSLGYPTSDDYRFAITLDDPPAHKPLWEDGLRERLRSSACGQDVGVSPYTEERRNVRFVYASTPEHAEAARRICEQGLRKKKIAFTLQPVQHWDPVSATWSPAVELPAPYRKTRAGMMEAAQQQQEARAAIRA